MTTSNRHFNLAALAVFLASALTAYIVHEPTKSDLPRKHSVDVDSRSKNPPSKKSAENLNSDIRKSPPDESSEPKNSTPSNLYLGVSIDSLDPVDVSIIREEVLLDIEFAQAMKAIDRDFFKRDEKSAKPFLQKLFSLPEVTANLIEFGEIKSEYGKTTDLIRKKELIEKMKLSRKSAVRLIDSAISEEKRTNITTPAVLPTEGR